MSIASETLRAEAARYRRLKGRLDDAQALKAIDDLVNDLEARADVMEGNVSE